MIKATKPYMKSRSMKDNIWFHFVIFSVCTTVFVYCDPLPPDYVEYLQKNKTPECWMKLKKEKLFADMDKLDAEYDTVRDEVQKRFDAVDFSSRIRDQILKDEGVAYREIVKQKSYWGRTKLPSGMQLFGLAMMKLPNSVIFFHRMKLRNDTEFHIQSLCHSMKHMVLRTELSLNTLHLIGTFDRSLTSKDESALTYAPTIGELEIVMDKVFYKTEGRYKFIDDRLNIELMVSSLDAKQMLMTYTSPKDLLPDRPVILYKEHIEDFLSRLKTNLDKWLMDYYNDYLVLAKLDEFGDLQKMREYDRKKNSVLSLFVDDSLTTMNNMLFDIGGNAIRIPNFSIFSTYGVTIILTDGTLVGLNTMHRRSGATTFLEKGGVRNVDAIIGFRELMVTYKYTIYLPPTTEQQPNVTGFFIMSSNDISAHLSLGLLKDPEIVEVNIDFINRMGIESLTIEGHVNLNIANIKHLVEHEIATIMSTTVTYGVGLLRTLPRCVPFIPGMLVLPTPKSALVNMGESGGTASDSGELMSAE